MKIRDIYSQIKNRFPLISIWEGNDYIHTNEDIEYFYSELDQRRKKAVKTKGKRNCIGTALYLVGEVDKDGFVYDGPKHGFFDYLPEADSPRRGYLVAWETLGEVYHAAVVVRQNPLLLASRNGDGGSFKPRQSFKKVNARYGLGSYNVKFYIPSKLQKILREVTA